MDDARCSCGFAEAEDETIGDHLIEVFAPDDGKGPDGKVHLEGEASLFCMCGAGGSRATGTGWEVAGGRTGWARHLLVDCDGDDDGGFVEVVAAHGDA